MRNRLNDVCATVWTIGLALGLHPLSAQASELLALEKGCMTCHGSPPKKNAPDVAALVRQLEPYRGQPGADVKLANKLREHHVFGGIKAHENLSEASALTLVRWLLDGAR